MILSFEKRNNTVLNFKKNVQNWKNIHANFFFIAKYDI